MRVPYYPRDRNGIDTIFYIYVPYFFVLENYLLIISKQRKATEENERARSRAGRRQTPSVPSQLCSKFKDSGQEADKKLKNLESIHGY